MAKKFPAIESLSTESQSLFDAVNDERDLPCVLISTSFIDQCLASMLAKFAITGNTAGALLDARGGALGTFSARSDSCYYLGLIPKGLFQNLGIMGEIRNRFAHSYLALSFDDQAIGELCAKLTFPKVASAIRVDSATGVATEVADPWAAYTAPLNRFTTCAVLMANRLLLTGLSVKGRTKCESGWN
jgi:hypothetical protein